MENEGNVRRLAAILVADVVGYSRLMHKNEDATIATWQTSRKEIIDPTVAAYEGRIVKHTGDGFLAEFHTVADAVRCAISMQEAFSARNAVRPDELCMAFRMGINLGDIVVDADDIHGDGVNIAARLEALAAPGGICISSAVLEQVKEKLHLQTEDLGERALKNIEDPVHAFRIVRDGSLQGSDHPTEAVTNAPGGGLLLLERPSVAIMTFRNLNGDAENDFIADGIALGIQTLMVQLSGLFLINACSDQGYRDGTKTAAEVTRDLPVRYVLEGTAQRADQRVRVTVQLTDLRNGTVVWADHYDRDLENVFALQDDITREVISSLNIDLFHPEFKRILTRDFKGVGAWEYFLRGISDLYKFDKEHNEGARQMFEKLYALCPNKVHGSSYVALTHFLDSTRGWTDSPVDALMRAAEWATKAVGYEDNDGLGHVIMSHIRLHEGQHDEALSLCEKAVEYRASCPAALGQIAKVQLYCGDAKGAVKNARKALNVRTMYPPLIINLLAVAYRDSGEFELSIPAAREAFRLDPEYTDALATLCSDHALSGNVEDAKRIAEEIVTNDPEFRLSTFGGTHPYKDRSKLSHLIEALRSAGVPE